MIEIPNQLRKLQFKFIKVKKEGKEALEKGWATTKQYDFLDEDIKNHIAQKGNYGVLTGYGNLICLDADSEKLMEIAEEKLPKTFTVKTSQGKHYYFYSDLKKKIVLQPKRNEHHGEIQCKGQYIVGPNCIHESGKQYAIIKDEPIVEILQGELLNPLKELIKQKDQKKVSTQKENPLINKIKEKITVPQLMGQYGFDTTRNPTSCVWHESQKGQCFSYSDKLWNCFHCNEGGTIFDLVMIHEECDFKTALKKLAQQSGFQTPSKEKQQTGTQLCESKIEHEGVLYEQVYDGHKTCFAYLNDAIPKTIDKVNIGGLEILPINDKAVTKKAVLLPEKPEDYETVTTLIEEIRIHIHKYTQVDPDYEIFASYYILMSWVYDRLNTLCYLRFLGDTGTGKSRCLDTIGRLCYKATILSGAMTPAPIFRIIERWGGTLIIDEGDLRDSSARNEIITILNCGFEKGRPVMRCDKDNPQDIQFFDTYGTKIIASRYPFDDKALESRCLTQQMSETDRLEIPPILPPKFYKEETILRNKLLMFRLKNYFKINAEDDGIDMNLLGNVEGRLKQATMSFASMFKDIPEMMDRFKKFILNYSKNLALERLESDEGCIVQAFFGLLEENRKDIDPDNKYIDSNKVAFYVSENFNYDFEVKSPARKVGKIAKSLGFGIERKRINNQRYNIWKWDNKLVKTLWFRYLRQFDDFDINRFFLENPDKRLGVEVENVSP